MPSSLGQLVPELEPFARELVRAAGVAGLLPRVTSTRRSHFEQVRLYLRFLRGTALFPVAVPGTSAHEYGEAFDMVVTPFEALDDVAAYWQDLGGVWGGRRDPVHFELPGASESHRIGPNTHTLGEAFDFLSSFVPYLGEIEMGAALIHMGFPRSEVLEFLSGPFGYLTKP